MMAPSDRSGDALLGERLAEEPQNRKCQHGTHQVGGDVAAVLLLYDQKGEGEPCAATVVPQKGEQSSDSGPIVVV